MVRDSFISPPLFPGFEKNVEALTTRLGWLGNFEEDYMWDNKGVEIDTSQSDTNKPPPDCPRDNGAHLLVSRPLVSI